MLLFGLNLQDQAAPPVVETPVVGNSKRRKLRYYAEIGGMRMLFPTAEARDLALKAEDPRQEVAEVIKKARKEAPKVAPKAAKTPKVKEPEWDDEEDAEMLLMAL